jgi:ribosomal protein L27
LFAKVDGHVVFSTKGALKRKTASVQPVAAEA